VPSLPLPSLSLSSAEPLLLITTSPFFFISVSTRELHLSSADPGPLEARVCNRLNDNSNSPNSHSPLRQFTTIGTKKTGPLTYLTSRFQNAASPSKKKNRRNLA
jgi:hypothetical protein